MKRIIILSIVSVFAFFLSGTDTSAQFRYVDGRILMGQIDPYEYYSITIAGTGAYIYAQSGKFLKAYVTSTGAPRISGHNNQVVFYNTQSSTFNSIQVSKVLTYSDARAKTGIRTLNNGLDIIKQLRPVTYNFSGGEALQRATYNQFTGNNAEIGLVAQELEAILPNLVFTDEEGHKLVDYQALIPVLIDAVQSLQQEVEDLKSKL